MSVKVIVMYPTPKDLAAFERAYSTEHIPTAARTFRAAGATKAVFTKVVGAPGDQSFHRIAEVHFPDLARLQACAASPEGQAVLAHAQKISNGGPPGVLIAGDGVDTLS